MGNAIVFKSGLLGDTITTIPTVLELKKKHNKIIYVSIKYNKNNITASDVLGKTGLINYFIILRFYNKLYFIFDIFLLIKCCLLNKIECVYHLESSQFNHTYKKIFFRIFGIKRFYYSQNSPQTNIYEDISKTAKVSISSYSGFNLPNEYSFGKLINELPVLEKLNNYKLSTEIILVGIGSNFQSKKWPIKNYKLLIKKIVDSGNYFPLILGTKSESIEAEELINYVGKGINLCGKTSIDESLYIVSEFVDYYIGNDSGLMHVAAIFKKKVLAIFSAIDYLGKWDPKITEHIVIREIIECSGCLKKNCEEPNLMNKCLTNISVERTLLQWQKILKS